MSAGLQELQDLKKALDKAMKQLDTDVPVERLMDILKAIQLIKVTPSLIKDSKMGKTLQGVRTKFSAESSSLPGVCNLARDIMVAWKQIVEDQMQKEKATGSTSSSVAVAVAVAVAAAEAGKPTPVSATPSLSSSAAGPNASSRTVVSGSSIIFGSSGSSSYASSSSSSSSSSTSLLTSFPDGRRKVSIRKKSPYETDLVEPNCFAVPPYLCPCLCHR